MRPHDRCGPSSQQPRPTAAEDVDPMEIDTADAELLAELGAVLRPDTGPPPEALAAARAVFTWRTVDAELAALTYDSVLDDEPGLVRAADQPRILTFEADGLVVEVEVDDGRDGRRLLGQLVPARAAQLELRASGDEDGGAVLGTGRADELGRFVLGLPGASRRLVIRVTSGDGTVVESGAVVL